MTSVTHRNTSSNHIYLNVSKTTQPNTVTINDGDYNDDNNKLKLRGIVTCIGAILIYLSLGSIYTFGNMLPYFASYLSTVNNDDNYIGYISKCNYIFALTVCAQSIFFPIGGKLGSTFGLKLSIFIGCMTQSILGVFCTYFVCNNYILIFITYGVLFGIGIGLSYPNILVIVMKWFPNHKGLVNGIVLCGFGISALIFDQIQTILINPNNYEQDALIGFQNYQEMMRNFPYIFLYLGSFFLLMQIIGILLISLPKHEIISVDDDETMPLIDSMNDNRMDDNDGFDVIQVIRDLRFWHLYIIFFVDGMIIVVISTQWKIFSNKLGINDDSYLSLIGSISAIFNGIGRIVFGYILDKTESFRCTLGTINALLSLLLFLWPFCVGNIMPFICVCLLFGLFSANFSIFPTVISQIFGTRNVGINVGLIFSSQIFSALIGIYLLDQLNALINDWKYMLFIIASIQLFGAALSFAFTNDSNQMNVTNSTQNDKKC